MPVLRKVDNYLCISYSHLLGESMLMVSVRGRVSYLITFWGLILALLLPMYGPWLDPTFAARQPYHNHLYLGEVNANHHSDSHDDHHHEEKDDCRSTLPDVINLPDQTIAQQLLLIWQPLLFTTMLPTDNGLIFTWQADGWRVPAIFLTPPERPPRS